MRRLFMRAAIGISLVIGIFLAPQANALPDPVLPNSSHLECVPVARAISGIQIMGNANTWWGQAEGRYSRGHEPRKGAVMTFIPHGAMKLGHVAAVSRVVDDRTVLVTHSNWSLINGRRGQIERNVKVIDVSERGDWSAVRVWYAPIQDLGTTIWPVHGFIYPGGNATAPFAPALSKAVSADAKPTGRLTYLGSMLRGLK